MADGWLRVVLAVALVTLAAAGSGTPIASAIIQTSSEVISRNNDGTLVIVAGDTYELLVVGQNFTDETEISFTPNDLEVGTTHCGKAKRMKVFRPTRLSAGIGAFYEVSLDTLEAGNEFYFLCVRTNDVSKTWFHQGNDSVLRIAVKSKPEPLLPIPVQVGFLVILLCLSGLFSGLNLGLMALDKTELKIIEKCGSPKEKNYAKAISPLRKRGNFLLCTLLLGNVLVNSTATVLLDNLSNGIIAIIASTFCIVVFGEIIPQAVCSRHGLAVGAKTSWITKIFMVLTFPVSFPISLILDKVLGEEIGQVYDKEKLQELIRMTADHKVLQDEEANIIAGALQLANKRVEDVMTKMEDVYMLDITTVLDFDTMSEILKYGYTRVPVYDGDKTDIVHLLNTKELALIDPDDNTPLKTVCRFYDHRPLFVDYDMKLDAMLQEFLQGNSHMAIVQRLHSDGDHDPYYENIGVVTLEDVIEEIIQSEIIDETDILTDNRRKKPRQRARLDYNVFEQKEQQVSGPWISQQIAFAAYQYLSTAVEPFKEQYVTRSVLKQLIRQNVVVSINPSEDDHNKNFIYQVGQECDYFVLILEGHVEVQVGKEGMVFESGPFSYYGLECLEYLKNLSMETLKEDREILRKMPPYVPDFSLRAVTITTFLRIRRVHYLAARRTTQMINASHPDQDHLEAFHEEWHRTVHHKDSMSRNSSGACLRDFGKDDHTSPQDKSQKRGLLSSLISPHNTSSRGLASTSIDKHDLEHRIHLARAERELGSGSISKAHLETRKTLGHPGTDLDFMSKADKSNSASSPDHSSADVNVSSNENMSANATPNKDSIRDAGDLPTVEIHDGRTLGNCSDTDALLPKREPGASYSPGKGEPASSPEDGVELEKIGLEDKVPLMQASEGRTGTDKTWSEEEVGETSPLVNSSDKNNASKDSNSFGS